MADDFKTTTGDDSDADVTSPNFRFLVPSYQKHGSAGAPSGEDSFEFSALENDGGREDDGLPDSVWMDLDYQTDAGTGQTADADPLPVLMVIADQQDFYFDEYP